MGALVEQQEKMKKSLRCFSGFRKNYRFSLSFRNSKYN